MARPQIALLLPVRCARRTLPSALADVLSQRDVELRVWAIVDGGDARRGADDPGDDGSLEFLDRMASRDGRLTVLRGPGRGVGAALDAGLAAALASGARLLAHMEADDRCPPDRLARLAAAMAHRPELCAVTSRAGQFGGVTPGMRRYLDWQNSLLSHADLARERFVEIPALHQTGLYRIEAVTAVGGYAARGDWPADIDFWLRWFEHDAQAAPLPAAKLPRVLYRWRQHPRQSTRRRTDCRPDNRPDSRTDLLTDLRTDHGGRANERSGGPGSGTHSLDALRAAKVYYLSRWLGTRPVVLLSTGATLTAWASALRTAGLTVRAASPWKPGLPPPPECRTARGEGALVLAAYGAVEVRARLRAAMPGLREPEELLFVA